MSFSPRALYGESIFTSFRSYTHGVPGLNLHIQRLFEGVKEYYFDGVLDFESFLTFFNLTSLERRIGSNKYFRITIFASQREEILPKSFGLADLEVEIIEKDLSGLFSVSLKSYPSPFSNNRSQIKSGSYFENIYLKMKARRSGFHDALFVSNENITEASTSNIIFYDGTKFLTPSCSSIFSGITLELFETFLAQKNIDLIRAEVNIRNLSCIKSSYILNSVQGLVNVEKIDNHFFTNKDDWNIEFFNYMEKTYEY